ncbi:hypothetical protein Q7P37_007824 [Cladosporium fusiforme]
MPSRRAHTKSRLGCVQCKARRVKCDQTYPTCKNCVRHEKTCVYSQVKSGPSSVAGQSPNPPTIDNGATASSPAGLASLSGGPVFDSLDMRLMHHYCIATAASLSYSPRAQEAWQRVMPDKAYTNHMLMHGLLTIAGFHYIRSYSTASDPASLGTYHARALHHQSLGLQMFREQIQNPSEDQSHELLLAYAATVGIITFAGASSNQQAMTYDDALGIFALLRGKTALWRMGSGLSPTSDLLPVFYDPSPPACIADLSKTTQALDDLHKVTRDSVRGDAIALLKSVTESRTTSEFRMLGLWAAGMSDEFLQLLKARDSVALQAFDHYCTILDSKSGLWWIGDLGLRMRGAIREAAMTV